MANIKRLFFDIENSSMVVDGIWQLKQNGYINPSQIREYGKILCLSYKWEGEAKVHTIKYDIKKDCDKELCFKFMKILLSADEVVGHNGDRHDIPWVKTRLLFHGIRSLPEIKSIDTLKNARKFKFPSNRLDEIAKYLGLKVRKVKTRGEAMWQDISRKRCRKSLNEMCVYCEGDVSLLEEIYNILSGFSKPKTNIAVSCGNDKWDCPHCGSINSVVHKYKISPVGGKKVQMQCKDCGKYYDISMKAFNDRQAYKQKNDHILKRY